MFVAVVAVLTAGVVGILLLEFFVVFRFVFKFFFVTVVVHILAAIHAVYAVHADCTAGQTVLTIQQTIPAASTSTQTTTAALDFVLRPPIRAAAAAVGSLVPQLVTFQLINRIS